ncbi:MAG: hypothetical protein A3B25_02330 [Candidatus Ryanbacteria bacterium RIFCSPLOWO2_01_FULL_48_26]|uniref:DUF4349 domain-containing protein n=1 Tax=Candidatus Ryanbacteria bacterium RIFCSPLOWO2_01_FULL_48_26 TaxID=1802126 RepID=A0A1G2GTH6_9BACT|nr:MAG: hypothetical protein A3B25_02330 [Candidatus Ryanbacteria bacterium RIFCSPLOWO2_01_FULL_48_26]
MNIIEKLKSQYGTKNVVGGILAVALFLAVVLYFVNPKDRLYQTNESGGVSGGAMGGIVMPSYTGAYGKGEAVRDSFMPPVPGVPPSTPKIPTADRKVIQNGSLDLLVQKAEETILAIGGIAERRNGFVEGSNVYEVSEGVKAGTITIRVPASDFAPAMEEVKKLAVKVKSENTNSQDVTAQFVDLEAQLKNYKAEEEQYRQIMAKAVKIEDVLNVASRLAEVRGRIEQTQGQLNYLSRQVDMSSISVSLTSEAEVQVFGIVWRPLTIVKQAFKSLLESLVQLTNSIIFFVFGLPVLIIEVLLVALVVWLLWKIFKWARRKFFPER